MEHEDRIVVVTLTYDEAYEILNHCLQSAGDDTPMFRKALRRLAWAIECRDEDTDAAA